MPRGSYTESTARLLSIMRAVATRPVGTSYDLAKTLKLPISSCYVAVNELERLGWLTHDEDGNLVVGPRALQIALHAHGYDIVAQRLVPIVRYLRDQTGETSFAGHLDGSLEIGLFLHGFNPNSITFRPFAVYGTLAPLSRDTNYSIRHFRSEDVVQNTGSGDQAEFLMAILSRQVAFNGKGSLVVGISWKERKTELEPALEMLSEVLKHHEAMVTNAV